MADTTYKVDETDKRLTDITTAKDKEISDSNTLYDDQINGVETYTDDQIAAVKDWANTQTILQNEQTDLTIKQINQQQGQAKSDYIKEQSGAYTDWQKQSNQYGVNAEQMAAAGLAGTGYSESSQVSMYNTYQNRVASARESYSRALLNYDNAIKEAEQQNSSALATIAYEALQKELELSLAGFQYKNTLIQEKAKASREISNSYWSRYSDMYDKILAEYSLNETARYHDASIAAQQAQLELEEDKFDWQKQQASSSSSGGSGKIKPSYTPKSGSNNKSEISQRGGHEGTMNIGNDNDNKTTNQPTVDMKSVLALGRGPLSAEQLANLMEAGVVKKYVEGNKIKFKNIITGGPGSKINRKGGFGLT